MGASVDRCDETESDFAESAREDEARGGALGGYTAIEIGSDMAVAYAGLLLALAGAEVVRAESPDGRERAEAERNDATRLQFGLLNGNKRSVAVDRSTSEGRELVLRLTKSADIVFGAFGPGTAAEDLTPQELMFGHPSLVCGCLVPIGQKEDRWEVAATELAIQAVSGIMSVTGYPQNPPVQVGPAVASVLAAAHLYDGIVSGLFRREQTGKGCIVQVAMVDALYPSMMSNVGLVLSSQGRRAAREGNRNGGQACAPYNMYPTSSGHLALRVTTDEHWQALRALFERDGLDVPERLATMAQRVAEIDLVDDIVTCWSSQRTTREAVAAADAVGVPCGPVRKVLEVVEDPEVCERGILSKDASRRYSQFALQTPLRFHNEAPAHLADAPNLGVDTNDVLQKWLDLSPETISSLRKRHVVS